MPDRDLMEPQELRQRLGEARLRVVDCRFSFDRDLRAEYEAGHVPGAMYCNWAEDLSDPPSPVRWQLASPERFARAMGRLGIGDDTFVVAYDAEGGHHAARLWWGLKQYGHDDVALLHAGIQGWIASGGALEPGDPPPASARFTPRARIGWRVTLDDVRASLGKPAPLLLDVRRESEFTGAEARSARGGHVPGAKHVEWREALDERWRLLPDDELRRLYADRAGIDASTPVVTYCHAGVRASFAAFVLRRLGVRDVRVYDGSWEEWGNRKDVPVETSPSSWGPRSC